MTGFVVDPDLLASRAVERRLAAARVSAHPAPAPVAEDAFGVIGRIFAWGAQDAALARASALAVVRDQFGVVAEELESVATGYRAADTAATTALGAAASPR